MAFNKISDLVIKALCKNSTEEPKTTTDGIYQSLNSVFKYITEEMDVNDTALYGYSKDTKKYRLLSYSSNIKTFDKATEKLNSYKNFIKKIDFFQVENVNYIFCRFVINNESYALTFTIYEKDIDKSLFLTRLKELVIILSESLQLISHIVKTKEKAEKDEMTGLWNRNVFETIKKLPPKKGTLVVALDLVLLKAANDGKNHSTGDQYIISAAKLLTCFFPEYENEEPTGFKIYRTGGDEFFIVYEPNYNNLISDNEINDRLTKLKASVENIDLPLKFKGINASNAVLVNESWYEAIEQADNELKSDKRKWYQEHPKADQRSRFATEHTASL